MGEGTVHSDGERQARAAHAKVVRILAIVVAVVLAILYLLGRNSPNEWFASLAEDFGSAVLAWLLVTLTLMLRVPERMGLTLPTPNAASTHAGSAGSSEAPFIQGVPSTDSDRERKPSLLSSPDTFPEASQSSLENAWGEADEYTNPRSIGRVITQYVDQESDHTISELNLPKASSNQELDEVIQRALAPLRKALFENFEYRPFTPGQFCRIMPRVSTLSNLDPWVVISLLIKWGWLTLDGESLRLTN